jgi:hypothetical protein
MKSTFLLFVLAIIVSGSGIASATGVLPAGQPEFELVYDWLEHMEALSLDRYDWQLGPNRSEQTGAQLGPFAYLTELPPKRLTTFGFAGTSLKGRQDFAASHFGTFRGGVAAQPIKPIFVYANFVLDEARAKDPTYTGKKWRGFAGDVENAFFDLHAGDFDLMVGRFAQFWGVRNSLVLAATATMDGFGFSYRWGKLTISYRLAFLKGLNPSVDSVSQYTNRYFAGHRFDFHFNDHFRVGLFETVVFGGPGRPIDFYYLNPLIFFHGSQLNDGRDDNTLVGADATWKPRVGYKLYGQLIIDDFQFDNKSQGDKKPNLWGIVAGLYRADIAPSTDIKLEYSRVTNWTYNQRLAQNRYLYDNRLISGALGDDYDLATVSLFRWLGAEKAVSLNLRLLRQGQGSVTAAWTEPWMNAVGEYSEPFPTGVVQTTFTPSLGFKGFLFDHLFVNFEAGLERVRNLGHVSGDDRTLPFAQITMSAFGAAPLRME